MSNKLGLIVSIIFMLGSAGAAYSQRRQVPEDQIKLGQKFFEAEEKCHNLLRSKDWKEAEVACKATVRLADRFADHRELEKMGAYESVGHSLMGQRRYDEAITYYSRALDVARPRLNDTNAEVGQVYGRMAMAYHAMRNLDKAREFYRRAAKTYQIAYSKIKEEDVTEEGIEIKRSYLKILKSILEYHLIAAEQAGASEEVEEIKKQMAGLPK